MHLQLHARVRPCPSCCGGNFFGTRSALSECRAAGAEGPEAFEAAQDKKRFQNQACRLVFCSIRIVSSMAGVTMGDTNLPIDAREPPT